MDYTYTEISKMIDHSLLNPIMTDADLEAGIQVGIDYDVASICIKPYDLKRCAEMVKGTTVKASTTCGFPQGGHTTAIKLAEASQALEDGVQELDMVCNIGKVLSGDYGYVSDEIGAIAELVHQGGAILKVIFENCFLEDEHKIKLCQICGEVGADFVKTSTGYGSGGATFHDLVLMRENAPAHVRVKAAGGVRDMDKLLAVRGLGVSRVGASRTISMMDECKRRLGLL